MVSFPGCLLLASVATTQASLPSNLQAVVNDNGMIGQDYSMLRREDLASKAALAVASNFSAFSPSALVAGSHPEGAEEGHHERHEDQWLKWSLSHDQTLGSEETTYVCPKHTYINRWAMRCGGFVDRIIQAECSDGTVLDFGVGQMEGASHTIVWLNGRSKFNVFQDVALAAFDTCGKHAGPGHLERQTCTCYNCKMAGMSIKAKASILAVRMYCQTAHTLSEKVEEAVHHAAAEKIEADQANAVAGMVDHAAKAAESSAVDLHASASRAEQRAHNGLHLADDAGEEANKAGFVSHQAKNVAQEAYDEAIMGEHLALDSQHQAHALTYNLNRVKIDAETKVAQADESRKYAGNVLQGEQKLSAEARAIILQALANGALAEKGAASSMNAASEALRKTGNLKSKVAGDLTNSDKSAAEAKEAAGQAYIAEQEGNEALFTARKVEAEEKKEGRIYQTFEQKLRTVGLGMEQMQQQKALGESFQSTVQKDVANAQIHAKAALDWAKRMGLTASDMRRLMEQATQQAQSSQAQASMAHQNYVEAQEADATLAEEAADAEAKALKAASAAARASREESSVAGESDVALHSVKAAMKTAHYAALAAQKSGTAMYAASSEVSRDMATIHRDIVQAASEDASVGRAVKEVGEAFAEGDHARQAAVKAMGESQYAVHDAEQEMRRGQNMRMSANHYLHKAEKDVQVASKSAALAHEAINDARKAREDVRKMKHEVHNAAKFAKAATNDADNELKLGEKMLAHAQTAKGKADTAQHEAKQALGEAQQSISKADQSVADAEAVKHEADAAVDAVKQSHQKATEDFAEAQSALNTAKEAAHASEAAVNAISSAAQESAKSRGEAVAAKQEADNALGEAKKSEETVRQSIGAAENALKDSKDSKNKADEAAAAGRTAQETAASSFHEADAAMSEAKQSVAAAGEALGEVESTVGEVSNLVEEAKSLTTDTQKIDLLLDFMVKQDATNDAVTDHLNASAQTLEHTVDGLTKTRNTQNKILQTLEAHGNTDDKIMTVLEHHENLTKKMMDSVEANTKFMNGTLATIGHQSNALKSTVETLENNQKVDNATITAQESQQAAMTSVITSIGKTQLAQKTAIETLGLGQNAMNKSLDAIRANQLAIDNTIESVDMTVKSQKKQVDAVKANGLALAATISTLHQGQVTDEKLIRAVGKKQALDDVQSQQHSAMLNSQKHMLTSITAQQATTDKLIGAVEDQQMSQSQTLETLNAHEKSMRSMLQSVTHGGKSIKKTLEAVEASQTAQGATLRAVANNNRKVRVVLGAVAQNQGVDEKTLAGLSSLSKMDAAQVGGLSGQVSNLGSRVGHLTLAESRLGSSLNMEGTREGKLSAELAALSRGEGDLASSESKDKEDVAKLVQNQEQIKQVQNTHHDGLKGLSGALKKNVQYVQEVASKALKNEKGIGQLDAQLARDLQSESAVEQGARSQANQTELLRGHISQYNAQLDNVEHRNRQDSRALKADIREQQKFVNSISQAEQYELQMKDKMAHVEQGLHAPNLGGAAEMGAKFNGLKSDLKGVMRNLQNVKGMEAQDARSLAAFEASESQDRHSMEAAQSQMGGEMSQLTQAQSSLSGELAHNRQDLNGFIATEHHLTQQERHLETEVSDAMGQAQGINKNLHSQQRTLDSASQVLGMEGNQITALTRNTERADEDAKHLEQMANQDKHEADRLESGIRNLEQQKEHFDEQTASLTKNGADILSWQDQFYGKIGNFKTRVKTKITGLKMQMLGEPSEAGTTQLNNVAEGQHTTAKKLNAANSAVDSANTEKAKVAEEETSLEARQQNLEAWQKKTAEADEQLEKNEAVAQHSIHIFSGVLVIIVVVFGGLHNMWHGKIKDLEKAKEEQIKAAAEAQEAEGWDENAEYGEYGGEYAEEQQG
eukprot:gnl/MRDRNA2_/MRDRNA2_89564_c0_seq1.p1 gnl/MRDRNA2_/MRDRNA2_89564_c0~~gnl/MRDRNA2_/MRDRNA2_89564_c0_seq1.p1  ORF type:complete len:1899 (+),score=586.83 gnl/MRDRNA2_/MRDRNA2_89564_c0_seq1:88-5784(+)